MNCAEFSYILLDNALNEDSSDWGPKQVSTKKCQF